MSFELAPAAVVRIGQWPLDTIAELNDRAIADYAATVDETDPQAVVAFESDYRQAIEHQRNHLWSVTAADPTFRCAVALASPGLEQRLGDGAAPPVRNKRVRHLETSLYRYLARGVARLEPCGLWCGVALMDLDAGPTRVRARRARVSIMPELAPFRAIMAALARREPYRSLGPYKLNPTLARVNSGWTYAKRSQDGTLTWRRLPPNVMCETLVRGFAGGCARSLSDLIASAACESDIARALFETALQVGLLVGGLALPTRFASPRAALRDAESMLQADDRAPWAWAERQLARLCDELEHTLEQHIATPGRVRPDEAARPIADADAAARALIGDLARALELPQPKLPTCLLRCDLAAPFRISLGDLDRRRIAGHLRAWEDLEEQHQAGRPWAALAQHALVAGLTSPAAAISAPTPCVTAHGPPLGALVLRPGARGLACPWIRGLSDVATATHARHAHHLARCGDRLLPWFRAVFADLARTHRVTIADLVHEHPGSPNVLARPQYTEVCVDPWGTEAEAVPWVEPRLVEGPAPGTTLLALGSARIAAHVFTATAVPASDVIVARLMATSFDSRLSAAGRDRQRGEQPEVPTSTRAVYQPERWRLSESELGGLLRTRSARRFVRWRQLAKHYHWPSLVRLVMGDAPAILVATESPLAVEAAFEGIRAPVEGRSGALVVEAVVERGWLQGPRGFHLTEIVVPVRRAHHLWSANKSDEAIAHG